MRIAIASVQVPFIRGGAEELAGSLRTALEQGGHLADIVNIPFKWYPAEALIDCMMMGRMMDLTEVNGERIDLVIALKFPAYYLRHPNKVVWLLHQHRQAYDLWGTEFGDLHLTREGEYLRETIAANDRRFLSEARGIFTISRLVSDRLRSYNGLDSTALYHPPPNYQQLRCDGYEPFVFYPSRIDRMKRQTVLVEAARRLKSGMRIVIAGNGSTRDVDELHHMISDYGLADRVCLTGRIPDAEKIDLYARCAAVYFGAYQEDYGYVPLEAFWSHKPVITFPDSGEVLQFVRDGENGYLVDGSTELADRLDRLAFTPGLPKRLGDAGFETIRKEAISWDRVIASLTGVVGA
jgi:glycosyltransferase involved in cell wall biosynthesis